MLKFETPMALTLPVSRSFSIAAQVSAMGTLPSANSPVSVWGNCSSPDLKTIGQWIYNR